MRDLHAGPKNKLTWWRMRRIRFGHFEWICRLLRAFPPSLTMCFSNFWCASVCFGGVERQMQLRVWMSKAFSDAFREVFKVGTIVCWYCSSSLSFFSPFLLPVFFCARDLIGCGQDADTFGFSYSLRINWLSCFCIVSSFVIGLLSASEDLWCGGWSIGGQWLCCAGCCALPVNGCPHKCSCSGSHVDCQGQGFRTVPKGIPRNAERL